MFAYIYICRNDVYLYLLGMHILGSFEMMQACPEDEGVKQAKPRLCNRITCWWSNLGKSSLYEPSGCWSNEGMLEKGGVGV